MSIKNCCIKSDSKIKSCIVPATLLLEHLHLFHAWRILGVNLVFALAWKARVHFKWKIAVLPLLLLFSILLPNSIIEAQTRRAFLVGINNYEPTIKPQSKCRKDWWNLNGCINDVKAMEGMLLSPAFRFKPENIHLLTDQRATKENILSGIKKYLIEEVQPGDICLFYYSGHGSRVKNSLSDEPDKMDETLVPADWYRGVGDIRDKELKKLYNLVLDKKAHLTVIIDACNSGSISRGLPYPVPFRSLPPDPCDVAQPPDGEKSPAERGALILSAAQDFQAAVETTDENNLPRGLFTWALLKVFKK